MSIPLFVSEGNPTTNRHKGKATMNTDLQSTVDSATLALIAELVQAWAAGDGMAFAKPFADSARFVAFDGTVLHGPVAIGRFHEQAFSTHLAGTQLYIEVEEIRRMAPGVTVAYTRGGIRRDGKGQGPLIGSSIQTFVIHETAERPLIESFQNTRNRPITGPEQAQVWREFDLAWGRLG
jgi:uncharacterized protein (TIGR02246 family)